MNYSFKHLILAGMAMLAGTLAYAQVTTSSLSGRVTDEKGQPALGAAVVTTHEPSGTVYGAVVNENGQYNIAGMRADLTRSRFHPWVMQALSTRT